VRGARTSFLAGGATGYGEAAPGDHLQTVYHLWVAGHQLAHGHAPWLDPYSFHPGGGTVWNPPAWPFGVPYWALAALLGPVLGWNVFLLGTYVLAGAFACLWLRELGLPRGAALVGGLAFALAPYRVAQSAGHLLGPIAALLPLALYGIERARRGSAWWLALGGAALASIPLSGQVHIALAAIPFFALYASVRLRGAAALAAAGAAVLAAIGAGLLIRQGVIAGSTGGHPRTLAEVGVYSAEWPDFVSRSKRHGPESFVFLGWVTPLAAAAGLVLLARARRWGLAVLLGIAAVVPSLLALGTNLPLYSALWHAVPPLRFPRAPERLMPLANLGIAALAAVAVARLPRRAVVAAAALVVVALDLHVHVYGRSAADPDNGAYAATRAGRLLELPIFLPDVHFGSVYLYYDMQARRERPLGYSTTAPREADRLARRLLRMTCGDWSGGVAAELTRLGVTTVAVHEGLYRRDPEEATTLPFAVRGLERHGWRAVGRDGLVATYALSGGGPDAPPLAPGPPVYCFGWANRVPGVPGRTMSVSHAPLWVYGSGDLRLRVSAPAPLASTFSVDGRVLRTRLVSGPVDVRVPLGPRGWHLVAVEVPHLLPGPGKRAGLRLLSLRVTR
jgi:hypothetical protein